MSKNKLLIILLLFCVCLGIQASGKKSPLKILYVGGNANIETVGRKVDSMQVAASVAERMASFEKFLKERFTTVKAIHADDYDYHMSNEYDVTIMDGKPREMKPGKTITRNGRFVKKIHPQYLPDNFDRPMVTIAEISSVIGRRLGVKNDWYCLCLDAAAHSTRTAHAIFNTPLCVKLQMEQRATPNEAKEFAFIIDEELPAQLSMWDVQIKGYRNTQGYKVGLVSRPWGYEDSPDAEYISGGVSGKSIDAVAIGRHGNFLHWGFSGRPDDMTLNGRDVFFNAIVYISQFAGQHIVARKYDEGIPTRFETRERSGVLTKKCWKEAQKSIETSNRMMQLIADSLRILQQSGKELNVREQSLAQFKPQPTLSFEEWMRQRGGALYEKFGTDEIAYTAYFKENTPYFYSRFDAKSLLLDEDAKSMGIANNDRRLLDAAITMWENGNDIDKAKRILERYTLLRYQTAKQFREWFDRYKEQLFFTESGGWYWLVNTQDTSVPGNDYSILHYNDGDEEGASVSMPATDADNPVVVTGTINQLSAGEKELVVTVKMHPGFHIYGFVSEQDPYIKTTFDMEITGNYKTEDDLQLPSFTLLNGTGTTIYTGTVQFKQRIKGAGEGTLKFTINYQACDDHVCLPPKDVTLLLNLK